MHAQWQLRRSGEITREEWLESVHMLVAPDGSAKLRRNASAEAGVRRRSDASAEPVEAGDMVLMTLGPDNAELHKKKVPVHAFQTDSPVCARAVAPQPLTLQCCPRPRAGGDPEAVG